METLNIKNITQEQQERIDELRLISYDDYVLDLDVLIKDFETGTIYTKWTNNSHLEFYYSIEKNGDYDKWTEKKELLRLLF